MADCLCSRNWIVLLLKLHAFHKDDLALLCYIEVSVPSYLCHHLRYIKSETCNKVPISHFRDDIISM